MGFLKDRFDVRNNVAYTLQDKELLKILGIDTGVLGGDKLNESIYFICLNHLAQTMSKMPRYLYQNSKDKGKEKIFDTELNYLLNTEPNPYYSASILWGAVELNRLHYGNAYVYKEYKGNKLKNLWILPSECVDVYMDDAGIFGRQNAIWYVYTDNKTGKRYTFTKDEIMHFKSHISFDGITGLAVKDIMKTQIESLQYSQQYQGKLFKNNLFGGKIILQYTGDLKEGAKDTLVRETERYANSVGSGKFLPIPLGITATSLDMKLTDADYVNLNKLNALQLAACFGVKPNVLNDYSKSSYSNSETQQLDFFVNSLQPIFKMYNDELTIKLLSYNEKVKKNMFIEIDKEVLFELDKETQMSVLVKGMNNFMITANEAREKLGLSYIDNENANKLFGNGNLVSLDVAGRGGNYGNSDTREEVTENE